jgi:DNA-binding response OmpR family regulator
MSPNPDSVLQGACILVVDDEIMIGLDIEATFREAGAEVIGPCTTLSEAVKMASAMPLQAAVLDVRLGRKSTGPVARVLNDRGIPFLFYSGQDLPADLRTAVPDAQVLVKPISQSLLLQAVARLIDLSEQN